MSNIFKIMTKGDKILIAFIIVASITGIFAVPKLLTDSSSSKEVVVNIDNKEIARFELVNNPESEFKEIPFEVNGKRYTARFEMKDGKVMLHRLPDEILPLGIHNDMGWISESYQMIVALPIKMYVTVEGVSETDEDMFDIIVQ